LNNSIYERNKHIQGIITKNPKRQFVITTGWIDYDTMKYLESMVKSNKVWWLGEYATTAYIGSTIFQNLSVPEYEAINIVTADLQTDNKTKLYNLSITVEIAIKENSIF